MQNLSRVPITVAAIVSGVCALVGLLIFWHTYSNTPTVQEIPIYLARRQLLQPESKAWHMLKPEIILIWDDHDSRGFHVDVPAAPANGPTFLSLDLSSGRVVLPLELGVWYGSMPLCVLFAHASPPWRARVRIGESDSPG